jgi:hypothetical protein
VGEQLRKLQQLEETDLTSMNRMLGELQLPTVFVAPKKVAATP